MELKLQNGDYVLDGAARLCRVEGAEALLQRVLFRLSARRGAFPFWGTLGSQLWQLGRLPAAARLPAARQYVAEALADEAGIDISDVKVSEEKDGICVTVFLTSGGEDMEISVVV